MTRTVCIIQARLGSTRLPAKVLLPLPTGRAVLEEVVHRCNQINGVDEVVVAIPDTSESEILLPYCGGVRVVRGPEHNVLLRYVEAARATEATRILRVTSDCPLINPVECERVLRDKAEYVSNSYVKPTALGWSCEAFSADALFMAHQDATDPQDREHVGPWMRQNALPVTLMSAPGYEEMPPSLDTLADYIAIVRIFEEQIEANPNLRAA